MKYKKKLFIWFYKKLYLISTLLWLLVIINGFTWYGIKIGFVIFFIASTFLVFVRLYRFPQALDMVLFVVEFARMKRNRTEAKGKIMPKIAAFIIKCHNIALKHQEVVLNGYESKNVKSDGKENREQVCKEI